VIQNPDQAGQHPEQRSQVGDVIVKKPDAIPCSFRFDHQGRWFAGRWRRSNAAGIPAPTSPTASRAARKLVAYVGADD